MIVSLFELLSNDVSGGWFDALSFDLSTLPLEIMRIMTLMLPQICRSFEFFWTNIACVIAFVSVFHHVIGESAFSFCNKITLDTLQIKFADVSFRFFASLSSITGIFYSWAKVNPLVRCQIFF